MATSADRMLSILALFNGDQWKWTVEEAAEALSIPTSTAYRYFKSLSSAELISSQLTGSYVLGPAVCELDRSMRLHDPFITAAEDEMCKLADEYPDTIILLAKLYKDKVMCVHRQGSSLRAEGYERGRPMPLDRGAASKVILANLPARRFRALPHGPKQHEFSATSALRADLRKIRAQGFSVTRGEIDPTKVGVSVPVFRRGPILEGSLSFVLMAGSYEDEGHLIERLEVGRAVIEANLAGNESFQPSKS